MAALINALDSNTPIQYGENGHQEYSWSSDLSEKILQLSFQMVRCDSSTIESLSSQLRHTLQNLVGGYKAGHVTYDVYKESMTVLYKMIGHTRDIIDGKGEYALSYMQIFVWNSFFPELAKYALLMFVTSTSGDHPFGSWKDIKYFCNYCKQKYMPVTDPLMQYAFSLINTQLSEDVNATTKSLAAKWIPREKSTRFGWIFQELAYSYFKAYLLSAKTPQQHNRAQLKCKTEYRKLVSNLNRIIDTVQIKQCANNWADIDHSKTTSITILKQKQAFLNITKDNTPRSELEDRIICAENFTNRIRMAVAGEIEIKGKRVGLENFTIQALDLLKRKRESSSLEIAVSIQLEIDLLNSQWRDNSSQTGDLSLMLAMLDFSGSMTDFGGGPYHCAMALGCRVAEKSLLGKRVLSFSDNPTWHNLDGCDTFVDMIDVLTRGEVGYSTNFTQAFETILSAIIEKKLKPDQVSGMIVAIFSDMQMDDSGGGDTGALYQVMTKKYADAGMLLYGEPFVPPHILFWNFRSTSGFPCLSREKNVSMLSGYSPALLNLFCEKGLDALKSITPWKSLLELMSNTRYQCLEDKIAEIL